MKVLVAEDDALSLRLLILQVEKLGHQPIAAPDGQTAWDLFQAHECRVVISDWTMPGLDGIELLARIRAGSGADYTYFIFLTARNEQEDRQIGMAAGADDLLTKPVRLDQLAARLRVAERIIRLQQEAARRNQELSLANERMRKDLHAAVQVQAALLPTSKPNLPDLDVAWLFRPCDQLGGDTLNLFRLDEHHLGFFILDVSGHGVSSALLAVQVSRVLNPLIVAGALLKRPIAGPPGYMLNPPLQVIRELNDLFPMNVQTHQYFTILYGLYHVPTHSVRFVSAGHPGPMIVRADGTVERIDVVGNPIGVFSAAEAHFNEYFLSLGPFDRLYCFSDGVFETVNPHQGLLGKDNAAAVLLANREQSLDVSLGAVAALLEQWRAGVPAADDVTMLAIERRR